MSESKHTPGEWYVRYGGMPGDLGFGIATKTPGNHSIVAEHWPVATTKESREQLRADAHLIAASKKLFEACLEAQDTFASLLEDFDLPHGVMVSLRAGYDEVSAALAAAQPKGE